MPSFERHPHLVARGFVPVRAARRASCDLSIVCRLPNRPGRRMSWHGGSPSLSTPAPPSFAQDGAAIGIWRLVHAACARSGTSFANLLPIQRQSPVQDRRARSYLRADVSRAAKRQASRSRVADGWLGRDKWWARTGSKGGCEACGCAGGGPDCWVIFLSDASTRFRPDGSWVRFEFGVRADHARDGCLSPCFRSPSSPHARLPSVKIVGRRHVSRTLLGRIASWPPCASMLPALASLLNRIRREGGPLSVPWERRQTGKREIASELGRCVRLQP